MKYISIALAGVVILIGIFFLFAGYSTPLVGGGGAQGLVNPTSVDPAYRISPNDSDLARQFKTYFVYLDKKQAVMTGVVQYCTGWLLIGLGLSSLAYALKHDRRAIKKLHKSMIR